MYGWARGCHRGHECDRFWLTARGDVDIEVVLTKKNQRCDDNSRRTHRILHIRRSDLAGMGLSHSCGGNTELTMTTRSCEMMGVTGVGS